MKGIDNYITIVAHALTFRLFDNIVHCIMMYGQLHPRAQSHKKIQPCPATPVYRPLYAF